ncbi:Myo-inositol 2-dehydrogenase 1 [hydrothermal vent metagenome]|uniref:Myo-inositol 2-dehydrogenase 1 n=1 Tax=hydrothermal vent metagenome TaxID=652676 RepID=A0A3B0V020_9ZZZZ
MSIKIGLIGAGRIGKVHAESIMTRVENSELLMVADVFLESANKLGEKYGIAATADYRDILNNENIDAVAICSSTDTHAQIIMESAAAGKHIFCEKPIDHSLAKIDAALTAVSQANVQLMVGFNRRFDPNFRKVKEMVDAGKVGQPHILKITSRDPSPPPIEYIKVSGGLFLDMTIHDFDMAQFLMGEVEEVYATGGVLIDTAIGEAGDIDTAVITLKFSSGAVGVIDNSRQASYGYDQRVEVFGDKGMVEVSNDLPSTAVYSHAGGVVAEKPLHFFLERYMDAYAEEMRQFVEAIANGKPVPVNGEDGRAPVVMSLAAWKSYKENRPVKLSEI